jgi:hypothetical protein
MFPTSFTKHAGNASFSERRIVSILLRQPPRQALDRDNNADPDVFTQKVASNVLERRPNTERVCPQSRIARVPARTAATPRLGVMVLSCVTCPGAVFALLPP